MYKPRIVIVLLLWGMCIVVNAQTQVSGIINRYAAVTNIDYCLNKITVDSPAAFLPQHKVLLIQMKGAQISTANNAQYGDVINYAGAGNYEINTIESVTGNVIKLKYAIARYYASSGAVQLITLPEYQTVSSNGTIRAKAWNGSTGGVVILKAETFNLSDSIDAAGKGFRGAVLNNETTCYNNGFGGSQEYVCNTAVCGALKGEGIGGADNFFARGKNGNGGGGGDDHNTGGGGGGNYGAGGIGGTRSNVSQTSCPGPGPGIGGGAQIYNVDTNRIFMGGGGGAGDENNNQGTAGANGGGICILMATNLITNNNPVITVHGNNVGITAQSDGAGGGGGAGTVLLSVDNYQGALVVDAGGGNGGVLDNGGDYQFCFGPGGGGGGGAIWVKDSVISPSIIHTEVGGINGSDVFGISPPACPFGTTNGAQSGTLGGVITALQIPEAQAPFIPLSASACCDTNICGGAQINLTATGTATYPPTFVWGTGDSGTSISPTVSNSQTYLVTVTDWRGCHLLFALHANVATVNVTVTATPDSSVVLGQIVQLTAISDSLNTYHWSPADGLSNADVFNPMAQPQTTTNYCVTVTDSVGCTATACRNIEILIPDIKIPDAFSPNNDGVNDEFIIFRGTNAEILSIKIYNRWGELVFNANTNESWDGTYKGKTENAGAFTCYITYTSRLNPGKTKTIVKSIILIR